MSASLNLNVARRINLSSILYFNIPRCQSYVLSMLLKRRGFILNAQGRYCQAQKMVKVPLGLILVLNWVGIGVGPWGFK